MLLNQSKTTHLKYSNQPIKVFNHGKDEPLRTGSADKGNSRTAIDRVRHIPMKEVRLKALYIGVTLLVANLEEVEQRYICCYKKKSLRMKAPIRS